jgi:hypothetical protein
VAARTPHSSLPRVAMVKVTIRKSIKLDFSYMIQEWGTGDALQL